MVFRLSCPNFNNSSVSVDHFLLNCPNYLIARELKDLGVSIFSAKVFLAFKKFPVQFRKKILVVHPEIVDQIGVCIK